MRLFVGAVLKEGWHQIVLGTLDLIIPLLSNRVLAYLGMETLSFAISRHEEQTTGTALGGAIVNGTEKYQKPALTIWNNQKK